MSKPNYLTGKNYYRCDKNDSVYIDNGYDKFYIFPDTPNPRVVRGDNEYISRRVDNQTVVVNWSVKLNP